MKKKTKRMKSIDNREDQLNGLLLYLEEGAQGGELKKTLSPGGKSHTLLIWQISGSIYLKVDRSKSYLKS